MKGKVKWYNVKNGYGFVSGEDGKDYFVHHTALKEGTKLFENDEVVFDSAETEKGLQARNVAKEGESTEAPVEAPAVEEASEAPEAEPVEAEEPVAEEPVEEVAEDDSEEEKAA